MDRFQTMVRQMIAAPPLKAAPVPVPREPRPIWPSIVKHGKRIDELHSQGIPLKQVAEELGMNFNTVRGTYSKYKKHLASQ